MSPFLEKKIKALNELKDFIDRAEPNSNNVDPKLLQIKGKLRTFN